MSDRALLGILFICNGGFMKMDWVTHSGARTWRLYFREPTQFAALLRLRDEDGWFEYYLRDQHGKVPAGYAKLARYTKLEGLRTLEEAQDAVKVIVTLTESATNR
jgi:hypothetical protein